MQVDAGERDYMFIGGHMGRFAYGSGMAYLFGWVYHLGLMDDFLVYQLFMTGINCFKNVILYFIGRKIFKDSKDFIMYCFII